MKLPQDFDATKPYTGMSNYTPIPVGPHCCRIVAARLITTQNGNEMLEVAFDIAEGGPDDGRMKERFENARKNNPNAKWPGAGIFRTGIITRDGKTNTFFKGLITAVEESNDGYSFKAVNCNENTLANKMLAFNFGEEEYRANDGTIRTAVKPFYAISVASARAGMDAPGKRLYNKGAAAQGFTEVPDEPLPF